MKSDSPRFAPAKIVPDPLPTKTVRAPDGSLIHYPDLPNVGEKYQPPARPRTKFMANRVRNRRT